VSAGIENSVVDGSKVDSTKQYFSLTSTKGVVKVHRAISFLDRLVGLLSSKGLPNDQGMYFPKCSAVHTIGMSFPIDVLFLDAESRVLKIVTMGRWRVQVHSKASGVLELNAGAAEYHQIKIGQKLWNI